MSAIYCSFICNKYVYKLQNQLPQKMKGDEKGCEYFQCAECIFERINDLIIAKKEIMYNCQKIEGRGTNCFINWDGIEICNAQVNY